MKIDGAFRNCYNFLKTKTNIFQTNEEFKNRKKIYSLYQEDEIYRIAPAAATLNTFAKRNLSYKDHDNSKCSSSDLKTLHEKIIVRLV